MKKKIKDLTLKEQKIFCSRRINCEGCCLQKVCMFFQKARPGNFLKIDYEEEIELSMQNSILNDFKKLKALDIIKEKMVDTDSLFAIWAIKNIDDEDCLKLYNNPRTIYEKPKLTKEEYDLLKEVLI